MAKAINFREVQKGDKLEALVKPPVNKVQLVRYAGASGDFNPLHTDSDVGKAAGIGGAIAHGMLIMGFVGQAITEWISKKYLKKFNVRFVGMTYPGDVVTVSGIVQDVREENDQKTIVCDVTATSRNNVILVAGSFEAAVPIQ